MCFETACTVMAKGSASSLTVAGPRLNRAMMLRLTGSARARKARSSWSFASLLPIISLFNCLVEYKARRLQWMRQARFGMTVTLR